MKYITSRRSVRFQGHKAQSQVQGKLMVINWQISGKKCGQRSGSSPAAVEAWADVAQMLVDSEPSGWVSAYSVDNEGNELEYFGGHAVEALHWFSVYSVNQELGK